MDIVLIIDLVLIDPQSVGKRTHDAKKRWKNVYWRVNKFLKESHVVTRLGKERAFLKFNDINDFIFGTPDCHHCCSIA
jgi:hypothetical protein